MSSKVHCYLRTLRLEWGLTQAELAFLSPKGDRNRVSRVERNLTPPNAREILAYGLIFGLPAPSIFRKLCEETEEAVMRHAYRLHQRLEGKESPKVLRKRELLDQLRARAIKNVNETGV